MIYAIIGCFIIIGFLAFKLFQKQKLDTAQRNKLADEVSDLHNQVYQAYTDLDSIREKTEYEQYKLDECKKDLQAALDVYQDLTETRLAELDKQVEEQREKRQEDLDNLFAAEKEKMRLSYESYIQTLVQQVDDVQLETNERIAAMAATTQTALDQMLKEKAKFRSLLEPLQQYEKEIQDKLFYTIQLPEEYQADIEFLLTTVAAQVQHPDIISKLVWNEYVKTYLAETCKRVNITDDAGIYKLTSLTNGKCYIGKSTNVKKRIQDHFKSVVGITSIADQAVHHAIRKEGFWNWTIEVITYCEKEKLNELERYYIEFFESQEYGYNKNAGGGG